MRLLGTLLSVVLLVGFARSSAAENQGKEFLMSCTYGVLAGSLVGAASLAFADQPGQSLNRVARGASIGLYAGILLGIYVVYIVPGLDTPEDENAPISAILNPRLDIFPIQSPKGLDGLQAQWRLVSF